MKITNEFTVHTPIDRAWQVLTDLEGIAPCLPGAALTGVDGDVYRGKVKVKVGPVISDFTGTARFVEKDASAHRAVIDAKGRDARAGGNATALVTAVLEPAGDSTLVAVDTDLKISGKLAQFGSGMIKEISSKLLAQFVTNLEAKLAASPSTAPDPTAPGDSPPVDDSLPVDTAAVDGGVVGPAAVGGAAVGGASVDRAAVDGAPGNRTPVEGGSVDATSSSRGTPSTAAVGTAPDTAAVLAPGSPAPRPTPDTPSPQTLTANLIPAEAGAAEPAVPAVAGSEPLATVTTTDRADAVAAPPATTTPPAPTTTSGAAAAAASGSTRTIAATSDPEPLDLLAVAGSSVYKRAIPIAVGVAVIAAVIVWRVARR
ncbi:SRPBCC family protein [Actinoplanes sp. URMC 104]|uniref:SRPBCC family protein n=1 Tax=Actinoplanes sp. URMC 104 TaxID=3423409 RepID=UPI003F1BE45B